MVRPKIIEAIHIQRHRVRPEPGPNTQNKPRELDPKGSHGLLCAHLRRKCRESVGGPDFRGVPPTEMREKCRRSGTFEGYLRQKCRESVGGPDFRGVPPTETREKCRRSGTFEGYLRRKHGKSVGGLGLSRGTSDGNTGKVSEVRDFRGIPPTEMREKCRRSSPANVHQGSQQPRILTHRPPELTKAKY